MSKPIDESPRLTCNLQCGVPAGIWGSFSGSISNVREWARLDKFYGITFKLCQFINFSQQEALFLKNPLYLLLVCGDCGALLRPDVVWFGEPLPMDAYEASHQAASSCDAMLVVGTSAVVRPAASLPLVAKHNGAFVVEVNVGYTPISALIDTTLIGRAGALMPALVDDILKRRGERHESEAAMGGAEASSKR